MNRRGMQIASGVAMARAPISGVRTLALRRGVLGGSRGWMAVAVVLWGLKVLRKASSRRPQVVSVERLRPGQTLQVTALPGRNSR
jgi:hypothetical protein